MPSKIKWSSMNTAVVAITGGAAAPTLKALVNATGVIGPEVDNSLDKEQLAEFELKAKLVSVPSGAPYAEVYLVEALDGTNYEDGDGTTKPAKIASFNVPLRAVNTQQRVVITAIQLPPTKFKVLLFNRAGVDFTAVDDENVLTMRSYSPEAQ